MKERNCSLRILTPQEPELERQELQELGFVGRADYIDCVNPDALDIERDMANSILVDNLLS